MKLYCITLIWFIVIPNFIVEYEHFCDRIDKRRESRKRRRKLSLDAKAWRIIARESEGTAKGYAIARLVIINHELDMLAKKKTV